MRITAVVFVSLFACGLSFAEEPPSRTSSPDKFFERLDTNGDGKVTLDEAPEKGKMLVEFLLHQLGKPDTDYLDRTEFMRLTRHHAEQVRKEKAAKSALTVGSVHPAPEKCPACAMGLNAEFVFKRLDVDEDKLVTVTEFRRSPGMDNESKAREVVERLDTSGDGKLSWEEMETAYKARHANCKKPDPITLAANAEKVGPDGRGDGNRFAQVFIMRGDQDGDGKISKAEFRGPAFGFDRLDKNGNGFIEANELGELHQRRLNDPKSMRERLKSGDLPQPPKGKRPAGLGGSETKEERSPINE